MEITTVIRAESAIYTSRDKKFTLGPLSFDIGARTVVALLGRNGAGKSTLLELLAGDLKVTSGLLQVANGENQSVALVPQIASLPPQVNVRDLLTYAAVLKKVPRKEQEDVVSECLQTIGLEGKSRSRIGSLSGGMKRRVLIGQALIGCGDLLLLDEPSAGLDLEQRQELKELIARLGQTKTIIVSTHIMEDVTRVAESALLLENGRLRFWGGAVDFTGTTTDHSDTEAWTEAFARSTNDGIEAES